MAQLVGGRRGTFLHAGQPSVGLGIGVASGSSSCNWTPLPLFSPARSTGTVQRKDMHFRLTDFLSELKSRFSLFSLSLSDLLNGQRRDEER
jgi:hypothetical protein